MAYALGLDVIAEGVEDAGQLDELRSLQCGLAQGYLFSRPVGPDELMAALAYAG
jgi:EAL domain-containing protein (putative c-di-GMP-specific phosphodiesterase class I)